LQEEKTIHIEALLHPHIQKRLQATHILCGMMVLIALFSAGCGSTGGVSAITTMTTEKATPPTTPITIGAKATSTPLPTATPLPQEPGWSLVWNDEFNGPSGTPPDASKWTPRTGGDGWGNKQVDYDTNNKNAYQDGQGHLVLEADRSDATGYTCWYGPCKYTSAQITTSDHFSFTYGRIEGRIKIPAGEGFWSAFWLLGNNCEKVGWPTCGEVDIMEILGSKPDLLYGTAHGPGDFSDTYKIPQGTFANDYHTYALQWDPDHLLFSVDGITYYTLNRSEIGKANWVYDHPYAILLNLPIGGVWPGNPPSTAPFPMKMLVDYVRVYTNS
jgi:beta-glucanase (GH16 family)